MMISSQAAPYNIDTKTTSSDNIPEMIGNINPLPSVFCSNTVSNITMSIPAKSTGELKITLSVKISLLNRLSRKRFARRLFMLLSCQN